MAAVTVCSDFGAQENKVCLCFHCFLIYLPWSDGTRCHDLRFLNVEFKPVFSLSSFTFIKRLFSSSLLSAISVVSSAYLRLLIFLPAILIPACVHPAQHFAWCTLHISLKSWVTIYSIDVTPFPFWNQSVVPCPGCFLTCIQISQETGQVAWYSHLLKNFPVCCDPHKDFDVVNKAEVDFFLELSCFFDDSTDVGNLIYSTSAFFKSNFFGTAQRYVCVQAA